MMDHIIYVRLRHRVQVKQVKKDIYLSDIAQIIAPEKFTDVENLIVHKLTPKDKNTVILDGIHIINTITEKYGACDVQFIGPQQAIVEVLHPKSKLSYPLFILVWFLLFIGSAITIMNFHEDVSMQKVHQKLFYLMTGIEDKTPLVFQIPYSIGLGAGMILFFNHLFKKRFNEEPSPLEVEMFNYQQSIDQYLIMYENKESMKSDEH